MQFNPGGRLNTKDVMGRDNEIACQRRSESAREWPE